MKLAHDPVVVDKKSDLVLTKSGLSLEDFKDSTQIEPFGRGIELEHSKDLVRVNCTLDEGTKSFILLNKKLKQPYEINILYRGKFKFVTNFVDENNFFLFDPENPTYYSIEKFNDGICVAHSHSTNSYYEDECSVSHKEGIKKVTIYSHKFGKGLNNKCFFSYDDDRDFLLENTDLQEGTFGIYVDSSTWFSGVIYDIYLSHGEIDA